MSTHALLQARDALHAALSAVNDALGEGDPPVAACDILEVDEAVKLSGSTPSTVRRWAAKHRLGRRLGGRWILSRSRFAAFLAGGAP